MKSDYVKTRLKEIAADKGTELKARSIMSKPYIKRETNRHGKTVYYFRKGGGKRLRLPNPAIVGMAVFNKAYEAAANGKTPLASISGRSLPSFKLEIGRPGYVYFVRSGDAVKIGFSTKPNVRIKEISTGCSVEPVLLKVIPGSDQTELYFHDHFARYRMNGEWFRLEGELAAFLSVNTL